MIYLHKFDRSSLLYPKYSQKPDMLFVVGTVIHVVLCTSLPSFGQYDAKHVLDLFHLPAYKNRKQSAVRLHVIG